MWTETVPGPSTWFARAWNTPWKTARSLKYFEIIRLWNSCYPLVLGCYLHLQVLVCQHDCANWSNTCDTIMWVPDKVNPLNFVIKSWKSVGTQSPWIKVNELNLSKLCSRIQNFGKKLGYNWSKNSEKKFQLVKSISSCQKPWEFSPVLQPVAK